MKQIRLSKGLFALVSDKDFYFLNRFSWYASIEGRGTKFYARTTIDGETVKMHRMVYELKTNHFMQKNNQMVVDHINHNSLDNRRSNLELITQAENMRRSNGWRKKGQKYASNTATAKDIKGAKSRVRSRHNKRGRNPSIKSRKKSSNHTANLVINGLLGG